MLRFRPTIFLSALLLALFFLPLVDSFTSPTHRVAVRRQQFRSKELPANSERNGFLRLTSTAAEEEIERAPKVGAKRDKITKEAQELMDVFASRAGGEANHKLIVAQVAPSVR